MVLNEGMTQTGEIKKKTNNRKPGDALIGIGTVLAIISFALTMLASFNGGVAVGPFAMVFAFLLLVVIGYLKRIAVAVERRA